MLVIASNSDPSLKLKVGLTTRVSSAGREFKWQKPISALKANDQRLLMRSSRTEAHILDVGVTLEVVFKVKCFHVSRIVVVQYGSESLN